MRTLGRFLAVVGAMGIAFCVGEFAIFFVAYGWELNSYPNANGVAALFWGVLGGLLSALGAFVAAAIYFSGKNQEPG